MNKTTYVGIIKAEERDFQTLVVAESEEDALEQVLNKFKDKLHYTADDVTIQRFMNSDEDNPT